MLLLTKANRRDLPPLYTTQGLQSTGITVHVKFFTPDSNWTWYATEFDGADTFFGYVRGMENELGYFSLTELKTLRGGMGLPIERDLHFGKHTLAEVMDKAL